MIIQVIAVGLLGGSLVGFGSIFGYVAYRNLKGQILGGVVGLMLAVAIVLGIPC